MKEIEKTQSNNNTHGFEHTLRVYNFCKKIGEYYNANMNILLPAAILHDIAREEKNHSLVGAEKAKEVLNKYDFNEDDIQAISEAIRCHSFSSGYKPNTIEGKILSDADKLDAMGAIGVFRAATYSQETNRSINEFIDHFYDKLLNLDDLLYTEIAKELGNKRKEFMILFLQQYKNELNLLS